MSKIRRTLWGVALISLIAATGSYVVAASVFGVLLNDKDKDFIWGDYE